MNKKFISVVLALVFVLSFQMTAFAENPTISTGTSSADVTASVTIGEAYTLSYPATVTLSSENEIVMTVQVTNLKIANGNQFAVKITSDNYDEEDKAWVAKNGTRSFEYNFKVKSSGKVYNSGDYLMKLSPGTETNSVSLTSSYDPSDIVVAGTYTDTLTINVAFESAE